MLKRFVPTKQCLRPCEYIKNRRFVGYETAKVENPKPYNDVPKVKGYPIINSLPDYILAGFSKYKELQADRLLKYGQIYREKIGGKEFLITSNPEDYEKILNDETSATFQDRRETLWSLQEHAKRYDLPDPMLVTTERDFRRRKEAIKKGLLVPKQVLKLTKMYDEVTKDLIKRIDENKDSHGNVSDVLSYLKLWSFECAGMTLFQTRLGALGTKEDKDPSVKKMIEALENFTGLWFKLEGPLNFYYRHAPSKTWNDFVNSLNATFAATKDLAEKYEEFVTDKNVELDGKERLAACVDVMRASVDTTSLVALWSLVEFSKHPDVQANIYEEIQREAPGEDIDGNVLQRIPYTRACLKEVLRRNPLTIQMLRRLNSDIVLSGYLVPANTLTILQTASTHVTHPVNDDEFFQPERWIKSSRCPAENRPSPYHSLPFGHGARACIGRRVAENELYIFYANIIRNFHIKPASEKQVGQRFELIMVPNGPVSLVFEKR